MGRRAGLFLSLVALVAGCSVPLPAPGETNVSGDAVTPTTAAPTAVMVPTIVSPEELGPIGTVNEFYRWYLAYINSGVGGPRNPVANGAYSETGYVAAEFAQGVAEGASDAQGGFDPFLCAQDVPSEVIPVELRDGGEGAAVDVRTSFAGHQFTVALHRNGAAWQIVNVICNPGEAGPAPAATSATVVVPAATPAQRPPAPQGWQVYRNEMYRFQVGYPQGWTIRETPAVEGQPPIGPANTKLVVMLMPQAWAHQLDKRGGPNANAAVLAPFTMEVTIGSEQEFWENYPEPTTREDAQFQNASAIQAVEVVSEEISIPHLVFQHPVAADLRVALTDPINGFADRKAAYPDVAAAFQEVANTFAWLD
jgi:hypothetical protein